MKIFPVNSISNNLYIKKNKEAKPLNVSSNLTHNELIGVPKSYVSFGNIEKLNKEMIGDFLKYIDVADDFYNEAYPIYKKRADDKIAMYKSTRDGWNPKYWFGKVSKTEEAEIREQEYNNYLKEKELYDKFRKNEAYYRSLIGSEEIDVYNKTKEILKARFTLSNVIAGYDDTKNALYKLLVEPIQKENLLGTKEKIPASILMYGPTGCGKSKIAKSISGEIGCNVIQFPKDVSPRKFIGKLKDSLYDAKEYYFQQKDIIDKTYKSQKYLNASIEEKAKIKAGLKSPRTIIVIDEVDKYFKEDSDKNTFEIVDMNKTFLKGLLDHCSENPQNGVNSDAAGVTILFTTNHPSRVDTEISLRSGKCERLAVDFPTTDDIKQIIKYYIDNYTNVNVKEVNNKGAILNFIDSNKVPYGRHSTAAAFDDEKGAHTCASIEKSVMEATHLYLGGDRKYNDNLRSILLRDDKRVKPHKIQEFRDEMMQMGVIFKKIDEKEEQELLSELKDLDMITDVQKLRLEYLTNSSEK